MKTIQLLVLFLVCVISARADQTAPPAVGNGTAAGMPDPYSLPPAQVASEFAKIRRVQIGNIAAEDHLTVPKEMTQLLTACEKNDWDGILAAWRTLSRMSGQYASRPGDSSGVQVATNADFSVFWPYVLDVFGFSEQVHKWKPELLSLYAKEMLKDLPPGAVLFGGTDPGRFVPTAYLAVQGETNRFVISQNPLADPRYMAYLNRMYGCLKIPSVSACSNVLQEYAAAVQAGKEPRHGIRMVDGKVVVEPGVGGVMAVNGVYAKWIFDQNANRHAFFVEESYVIQWMFPYQEPAGPIMKLTAQPGAFRVAAAADDRLYWDALAARLTRHPDYAQDDAAKVAFSKMRSAIGGLYTFRGSFPEAEYAFRQAVSLDPKNAEPTFRLADLYMRMGRESDACTVVEAYIALGVDSDRARAFLADVRNRERLLKRKVELEAMLGKGVGTVTNGVELAGLYLQLGQAGAFEAISKQILTTTNYPTAVYRQLADVCTNGYYPGAADIRKRALERASAPEPGR